MSQDFPLPKGFSGGAMSAKLKVSGKPDLGVILSETPCTGAGVFTLNAIKGANIPLCQKSLSKGDQLRGILIHSGQANVCTGEAGNDVAKQTLETISSLTGSQPDQWILGSTGVIGVLPNMEKLKTGIQELHGSGLSEEGLAKVPRAMMTTDLTQKVSTREISVGGQTIKITGFAKGSGMIHPNMATMLVYIMTDAKIDRETLDRTFRRATDRTFNCLTVDGDTSTSDMAVILANGQAGNDDFSKNEKDLGIWEEALTSVCRELTRMIARDGEGATKLLTINVAGAQKELDARTVAMSVGTSSLVKTAICGCDPNWGRIAAAVGYSGVAIDPAKMKIWLLKTPIFNAGEPVAFEKKALSENLRAEDEIIIDIDLGLGDKSSTVWSCDLTKDYVRINSEYTT